MGSFAMLTAELESQRRRASSAEAARDAVVAAREEFFADAVLEFERLEQECAAHREEAQALRLQVAQASEHLLIWKGKYEVLQRTNEDTKKEVEALQAKLTAAAESSDREKASSYKIAAEAEALRSQLAQALEVAAESRASFAAAEAEAAERGALRERKVSGSGASTSTDFVSARQSQAAAMERKDSIIDREKRGLMVAQTESTVTENLAALQSQLMSMERQLSVADEMAIAIREARATHATQLAQLQIQGADTLATVREEHKSQLAEKEQAHEFALAHRDHAHKAELERKDREHALVIRQLQQSLTQMDSRIAEICQENQHLLTETTNLRASNALLQEWGGKMEMGVSEATQQLLQAAEDRKLEAEEKAQGRQPSPRLPITPISPLYQHRHHAGAFRDDSEHLQIPNQDHLNMVMSDLNRSVSAVRLHPGEDVDRSRVGTINLLASHFRQALDDAQRPANPSPAKSTSTAEITMMTASAGGSADAKEFMGDWSAVTECIVKDTPRTATDRPNRFTTRSLSLCRDVTGGLGFSFVLSAEQVVVAECLPSGAAAVAGLAPYDTVIQIDGVSTRGLSAGEISGLLRGNPMSSLTLLVGEFQEVLASEIESV